MEKKMGWIPKYTLKELKANHNRKSGRSLSTVAGFQNTLSKN